MEGSHLWYGLGKTWDSSQYIFQVAILSLLLLAIPGSESLTHQHSPQLLFSSPSWPLSLFPLHLLHLPFPLPGVCKGKRETRVVLVGNGRDCQLHGDGDRWSPVLQRNGGKRVGTQDSCTDPCWIPPYMFLPHHQFFQNPNTTYLSEMLGPVLPLRYETGLQIPEKEWIKRLAWWWLQLPC